MTEARFREYLDALPCYLTVQDKTLRIIHANRRFEEDFGEWSGRFCYQVYKHRSEPCEVCPVEKTFRDGSGASNEELVRNLEGREIAVLVNTTPLYDEHGAVTAVLEQSTDVSDLVRLQVLLRESQQKYRLLFDEAPCFVSIQDSELRITEANRAFREAFGEAYGSHCYRTYKHRGEVCSPCPVQETFKDGQVHTSEEVVASPGGETVNVLVRTAPLKDDEGSIRAVMEMSTDITELRRLQDQLTSIGLLISSISHGIKGLLTGMGGGIYLVNSGFEKNDQPRVQQGWEMVQRNIDRIRSMVLNILYYAKERPPDWRELDLGDLCASVAAVIAPKAAQLGITFTVASELQDRIEGDEAALRAMLLNLLENAVDACRLAKDGKVHRVTLGARREPGCIVLCITDDGIGMDQETCNKAFSLFFSSKGLEGTGLGLFIANQIAETHGGDIRVSAEPGRGSRFEVTLRQQRLGPSATLDQPS